jgi:hypothetical protein
MSTMTCVDLRRTDQRDTVLPNPFWMTSASVKFAGDAVITQGYSPSLPVAVSHKGAGVIAAGTIAAVDSNPDTLTDSGSGFVTAGFANDDVVYISGFTGAGATANLNFATIAAAGLAAGTLTFVTADALTADAAGETVTVQEMKPLLLFSFPVAGQIIVVHEIAIQVITGFTSGTKFVLGYGSIATDTITTGGVLTNTYRDGLVDVTAVTMATAAYYGPGTASAWYTAAGLNGFTAPRIFTGAAATTPTIHCFIANAAAINVGELRVHLLVSKIPGMY